MPAKGIPDHTSVDSCLYGDPDPAHGVSRLDAAEQFPLGLFPEYRFKHPSAVSERTVAPCFGQLPVSPLHAGAVALRIYDVI